MNKLALFGGNKSVTHSFERYNSIGKEEIESANQVLKSGILSEFQASWHNDFYGGSKVKQFESNIQEYFQVKYATTVNSWTSGLIAIFGAIGIEPGDEVIVPTWTMCATATAIIHWNAIPVFADIEKETFNIDPASVVKSITKKTKAIIAVDIFGHSCNISELKQISKKHNLMLITDSAQSPGAMHEGNKVGSQADVGGFSLNYHKHIHTGEGGIIVTNNEEIHNRCQLIRNHAEAIVGDKGEEKLDNMVGYNFRLGEIEAAIGIEQLKKLDHIIEKKQSDARKIYDGLKSLEGIRLPIVKENCSHVYYMFPMVLDIDKLGISRKHIVQALEAEGVEGLAEGYVNLHMLPIYQKKIAYGSKGYPWRNGQDINETVYDKGICPVAEELHEKSYFSYEMCMHNLNDKNIEEMISAFQKVWSQLDSIRENIKNK